MGMNAVSHLFQGKKYSFGDAAKDFGIGAVDGIAGYATHKGSSLGFNKLASMAETTKVGKTINNLADKASAKIGNVYEKFANTRAGSLITKGTWGLVKNIARLDSMINKGAGKAYNKFTGAMKGLARLSSPMLTKLGAGNLANMMCQGENGVLPSECSSELDYKSQLKLEEYYKKNAGNLTDSQKAKLVSDLKELYTGTSEMERGDITVPEDARDINGLYKYDNMERYDYDYNWADDDTVPATRKMEVLKAGEQFDRLGSPNGRCVGHVGDDGSCATIKERSVPYHFEGDEVTQEPSYHRYEAKKDFTRANLEKAIDNSLYSDDTKAKMHVKLNKYYYEAEKKYGQGDGLATGEIAEMFNKTTGNTGGGWQSDMPFNMNELKSIGMIKEVPKRVYANR